METRTFLDKLPKSAKRKPLVAKIKILKSNMTYTENKVLPGKKIPVKLEAQVEVVEAIKGCNENQKLSIIINIHSCSREPQLKENQKFFIAGNIDNSGKFEGEWREKDLR